jgi:hypothetical protein
MTAKGIYIYGIVPNLYGTNLFRTLEDSSVYAITCNNISAIVSDRENAFLDFLDREFLGHLLIHHQKTIEELMGKGFNMIIPMKLGTIVRSTSEVQRILTNGYDLILKTFKNIEYLTEIDLAVTWADFSATLHELGNHPEIAALKSEILLNHREMTQLDQVKVGMIMKEKLGEKNKAIELKILEAFTDISEDIKIHDVMNDQMITNSAILIKRSNTGLFNQIIEKLDEKFDGTLNFKIVGPLPCYSFFTLEVKELHPDRIENARTVLGVPEETTEGEIKKAYFAKAGEIHPDKSPGNNDGEAFDKINKAYNQMLEYALTVRQLSKEANMSLKKENVLENTILVTIKE